MTSKNPRKNNNGARAASQNQGPKIQVSPRVLSETLKKVEARAKIKGIAPNTYMGLLLDKTVKFLDTKEQPLVIDKEMLKGTYANEDRLEESAIEYAEGLVANWRISNEPMNIETFDRRFTEWHIFNHFKAGVTYEVGKKTYKVVHSMDKKWSKYQALLNKSILEQVGYSVINMDINKFDYYLTIAHHRLMTDEEADEQILLESMQV